MSNIYEKIQACRASIKASNLKKAGHNDYSNYDYYTPEQVDKLVYDACLTEKVFCKFDLDRDENGLYGRLTAINLEDTKEELVWKAATEMPTITATNASQQMGGCMTFSERYLKQTAFDIVDNNLDFDSQDNTKKSKPTSKGVHMEPNEEIKEWLNEKMPEFELAKKAIKDGKRTVMDIRKKYKVSKATALKLES